MPTEHDQGCANGGRHQRRPADVIESLSGEHGSGNAEEDGHGADHQGCVADGGVGKAVELDEELDGDTKRGRDKNDANLAPCEANPVQEGYRQQAKTGKEEAVEHHVLHAHLVQSEASEIEASPPEGSSNRACAIAKEFGARAQYCGFCHASFYCRISGGKPVSRHRLEVYLPSPL